MSKSIANFKGAVLGAAIGDAIGFLVEKKPITTVNDFVNQFKKDQTYSINSRINHQKNSQEVFSFGQYSDDTQFSKLLIQNLISNQGFNSSAYINSLTENFRQGKLVGIGKNTSKILSAQVKNQDTTELIKNTSNGSLMRAWPIGLYYSDTQDILTQSAAHSVLTHNTDEAIKACQILALSINHLKNFSISKLPSFWQENNLLNLNFEFLNYSLEEVRNFVHNLSPCEGWEYVTPSATSTLAAVMYSVYNSQTKSFREAILMAISLGGDTDSVASLVGALIGYHHAAHEILWNDIVHDRGECKQDFLIELSKQFYYASK